jgi:hypothetical protein
MKKTLFLIFTLIALTVMGCGSSKETAEAYKTGLSRQNAVNELVAGIIYFQNPSTKRCYVYYRGNAMSSAPAITSIDCQQVPPGLLNRFN